MLSSMRRESDQGFQEQQKRQLSEVPEPLWQSGGEKRDGHAGTPPVVLLMYPMDAHYSSFPTLIQSAEAWRVHPSSLAKSHLRRSPLIQPNVAVCSPERVPEFCQYNFTAG
uniref:Uncharacterized protein n=1 Tax=Sphaerodactylus townsendi TaxID=933632 RepID=A0ACB8FMN9_9SAUR